MLHHELAAKTCNRGQLGCYCAQHGSPARFRAGRQLEEGILAARLLTKDAKSNPCDSNTHTHSNTRRRSEKNFSKASTTAWQR